MRSVAQSDTKSFSSLSSWLQKTPTGLVVKWVFYMSKETKIAPAEEANETEPTISEVEEEAKAESKDKPEATKEEKIGDVLKDEEETTDDKKSALPTKKQEETVPLSVFLEVKNDLKDLKESIRNGATQREVNRDLKAIAEKHDVSLEFIEELGEVLEARAEARAEARVSSRLKPLEEKEKSERFNRVFEQHYNLALENNPEFKDIANKDVIRSLVSDPRNSNKTFSQVMDEAYGHLVTGKKTLESPSSRSKLSDTSEINYEKAQKDEKYFSEIMANPVLKEKYNKNLEKRLNI